MTIEDGVTAKTERYERGFLVKKDGDTFKIVRKELFVANPMNLRLGAIGYNNSNYSVSVSGYYDVFELDNSRYNAFWYSYLKSPFAMKLYDSIATGSLIEKRRVHFSEFKKLQFPVPCDDEKQKISTFLTLLDERISKQRELVENLKLYKRGVLSDVFSRKIRFKNKNGEEYPKWQHYVFSDVFTLLSNNTFSRSELSYTSYGVYNIHYGDILIKYGAFIDFECDTVPTINKSQSFSDNTYLKNGDIIFADTAEDYTVGKATEITNLNDKLAISGLHTIPCRPKLKFADKYLGYYFNSYMFRKQLFPAIQGTKVSSISKSNLQKTYLDIPCIEEQMMIANFLSAIDSMIIYNSTLIGELIDYRKSLLKVIFI